MTSTVAVTGAVVVFITLNDAISPVPLAPNPIAVLLFVQLKVVPTLGEVKCI